MRYEDDFDDTPRRNRQAAPRRAAPAAAMVRPFYAAFLPSRSTDLLALGFAAVIAAAIAGNALVRQTGPHPAPMFAPAPAPVMKTVPPVPVARPVESQAMPVAPVTQTVQSPAPLVATRPAVATSGNDDLARMAARAAGERVVDEPKAAPKPAQPKSIASLIAASESAPASRAAAAPAASDGFSTRQTMAIEKALDKLGFMPGKIDGAYDRDLRAAIEAFERKHKWPVSGQLSTRLAKELGL